MYKMIAATLVALYLVFTIFGDESRRPAEVARAEASPLSGFDFSDWITPVVETTTLPAIEGVSASEAIEIAMAAGRAHREDRKAEPLAGALVAAVEAPVEEVAEDPLDVTMWYVTGTTVNVRAGPGTSNPVVTQVSFGEAAEILTDTSEDWVQIRPQGGETTGWIATRFLNPTAPG